MPAYTFVATAVAAELCGYQPYFVDIHDDTWLLEPEAIYWNPVLARTGVVLPVATYGRPVSQQPWLRFRESTGIPVVIDGAASFEGVTSAADPALGALPVALSFHATKSFGVGEGGCVVSTDLRAAVRVTEALNFGFYGSREARVASTNGKLSEYHAAVGLAELDSWPEKRALWESLSARYLRAAENFNLESRFPRHPPCAGCYALLHCADTEEALRVQASLVAEDIEFRLWYGGGLHTQPHFRRVSHDPLPVTSRLAPVLLGLPAAVDLPDASIDRVLSAVAAACNARR
jgi:dTDP-4-amino-4,6-dideoxygalactose transaminase